MKLMIKISSLALIIAFIYALSVKSLVVLHYEINKTTITQKYCINKDKSYLHCNGKCYLIKQITKIETPANGNLPQSINYFDFEYFARLIKHKKAAVFFKEIKKVRFHNNEKIIDLYPSIDTPPPKV